MPSTANERAPPLERREPSKARMRFVAAVETPHRRREVAPTLDSFARLPLAKAAARLLTQQQSRNRTHTLCSACGQRTHREEIVPGTLGQCSYCVEERRIPPGASASA